MLYFLTTVFISHIPQWQAVKNLKIASCRDLKCQKITARHRWGVLNKGEMYDDHSNIKWHAEIKLFEFNVLWKRARRIQCPGAVNASNIQSFGACLHMSAVEKYDLLSSTIFGMKQGRMYQLGVQTWVFLKPESSCYGCQCHASEDHRYTQYNVVID